MTRFWDEVRGFAGFVIVPVIVITAIIIIVLVVGALLFSTLPPSAICSSNTSQRCIDYRMDQCMQTEEYTKDQCVELVGR